MRVMPRMSARMPIGFLGAAICLSACGPGLRLTGGGSNTSPVLSLDSSWLDLSSLAFYAKLNESPAIHFMDMTTSDSNAFSGKLFTSDGNNKSTAGIVGGAFSFDGTDDYVSITDPGAGSQIDFAPGTSITILAWVKPAAFTAGNDTGIVTKGNDGNSNFRLMLGVFADIPSQRKIAFSYFDGGTWHTFRTTPDVFTAVGEWAHLAVTFTYGTGGSAKIYVNGSLMAGSWVSGNGTGNPVQNDLGVFIGSHNQAAGRWFNGTIDDVSIWRRVLSAAEISTVYDRQKP